MSELRKSFPVAVVGMHGRFPDAYDVKDFWANLIAGNDSVRLVPKERWDWEKLFGSSANENESTQINAAAFMPLIDRFDCRFFGILPREAEAMDPQQRLFIQTAYAALEDAGYAPSSLSGSNTGVFVGIGNADYPMMMRRDDAAFDIYRATGMALTSIANRVSFSLNIHGPSESIDTACSGSLVAIHHAIRSMQNGECGKAIVGGVSLLVGPDLFIAFDKAGMLSKSARSRTFDAGANGYVRGEGVAALVLCPLDEAERNGDYIYGVIQGSAVNHGGRAHSFTAPNAAAQAQVVKAAWESSGKDFHSACIIETHGTGTPLGDPIEVNGLKKVSEELGSNKKIARTKSKIALGALKSHVGHMEATAGVGGVIKTLLSMKYRVIPKNLHYEVLNPHIDLNGTPYYVPAENEKLKRPGRHNLLAGVSSFGFGGVNAHVVLESWETKPIDRKKHKGLSSVPYLIPLSGKDKTSLHGRVRQLIGFLEESCGESGRDAVYKAIITSLSSLLAVDFDAGTLQPLMLESIVASPVTWARVLKKLSAELGRVIQFSEIADCVSLQEAARKIARNTEIRQIVHSAQQPVSLCSRVALPEAEIKEAGLDQIAYALMHGRDVFKERIACIAHSKTELLHLLRAYLQAPDSEHALLWAHAIRMDDPSIDQPNAASTHADIATLSAWAAWWVGTKSAALNWSTLYPATARPAKIPLPAYPFQLDRIWYKAAQVVTEPEQNIVPDRHAVANSIAPLTSLPSGIASAWDVAIQHSQVIVPSSVMSLAYLLDYARYKNRGAPVNLKDMLFGRPCGIEDSQIAFAYPPGAASRLIQCFTSKTERKVLAQASVPNEVGNISAAWTSDFTANVTLAADEFMAQLGKKYLSMGPILQCLHKIQVGDRRLGMDLDIPAWKAKNSGFWVPLMACMLSGLAYLNQQQNKSFQLPWKIQSVLFNPDPALAVKSIYIKIDQDKASVRVVDEKSNMVLALQGMELRQSSIVKLPLKMPTESRAVASPESLRSGVA